MAEDAEEHSELKGDAGLDDLEMIPEVGHDDTARVGGGPSFFFCCV